MSQTLYTRSTAENVKIFLLTSPPLSSSILSSSSTHPHSIHGHPQHVYPQQSHFHSSRSMIPPHHSHNSHMLRNGSNFHTKAKTAYSYIPSVLEKKRFLEQSNKKKLSGFKLKVRHNVITCRFYSQST